jgi:hypothetical protein
MVRFNLFVRRANVQPLQSEKAINPVSMKLCHFSEFEAETESFAGLAADVKCD